MSGYGCLKDDESYERALDDIESDIFEERVELKRVPTFAPEIQGLETMDGKTINAFNIIGGAVDLSSMFEKQNDIVHK